MRKSGFGFGLIFFLAALSPALAEIKLGSVPKPVALSGETGGLVKDDGAWDSGSMKGAVHMFFYVDPDEKSANEALEKRLKDEQFDQDRARSVAVINMAATWKPNMVISSLLEGKQKDYPRTTYVRDFKKVLVKEWDLRDDSYHVLLFDKNGVLLFEKAGTLAPADIEQFVTLVKQHI